MPHQMPQGETFKSVALSGKERRAYFNFSKLSVPSGLVTLSQCLETEAKLFPKRGGSKSTAWLLPRAAEFISCQSCKRPRSLNCILQSKCFLGADGALKGCSSVSPEWKPRGGL